MKYSKSLVILLLILGTVRLSFGQKPNMEDGKAVYAKKCASCHGASGEGNESIAKATKTELPKLGSKEVQALKDDDLRKVIREGKGKMKGVKDLTDQDVANVVAYLRTLSRK